MLTYITPMNRLRARRMLPGAYDKEDDWDV
jgi:hypothetical protein